MRDETKTNPMLVNNWYPWYPFQHHSYCWSSKCDQHRETDSKLDSSLNHPKRMDEIFSFLPFWVLSYEVMETPLKHVAESQSMGKNQLVCG